MATMRHRIMFFAALLIMAAVGPVLADLPDDIDHPLSREQLVRIRERIETLKMWKLTKALDLEEKTSARLFPVLGRYDKKKADIQYTLIQDVRDLKSSLQAKNEGRTKAVLDRLEARTRELQGVNEQERAELRRVLTVEQQAKYLLFQLEFAREMRRIISEVRERRTDRGRK